MVPYHHHIIETLSEKTDILLPVTLSLSDHLHGFINVSVHQGLMRSKNVTLFTISA